MAINSVSQAQINVTPLIDVLLVLLIIFMAIAPTRSTGMEATIPQAPVAEPQPAPDNLVVSIGLDLSIELNSRPVSREELHRLLRRAFSLQPDRAVFLRGAKQLEYRDVAALLDDVRAAGAMRVGLLSGRQSM